MRETHDAARPRRGWALAVAGAAAALASSCCVLPLALFFTGLSGAWMSRLKVMEPYSPWLIATSILALAASWKSVFRPAGACAVSGAVTARLYKPLFWAIATLVLGLLITPLLAPLFY